MRALFLVFALFLCGCAARATTPLAEWSLEDGTRVRFPSDLRDRLASRGGTIRVRTQAALAPEQRGRDLSLAVAVQWCPTIARVNGVALDDVERTRFDRERTRGHHLFRIPRALTDVDALPIELEVTDTFALCSYFMSVPDLSVGDYGSRGYAVVRGFNDNSPVFAVSVGLLIAAAFAALSLSGGARSIYRWAAMVSLAGLGLPLGILGVFQTLFGYRGDAVVQCSVVLAAFAGYHYACRYVNRAPPRAFWTLFALAGMVVIAVLAQRRFDLMPMFVFTTCVANVFFGLSFAAFVRHGRGARNVRLLVAGMITIWVTAIPEALPAFGLEDPLRGAHTSALGITAFSFLLLVAFVRDYHASAVENTTLNVELRRQVAERGRDLADALAGALPSSRENHELGEGDVVEGRYAIVRTLGRGGMGVVYEVRRTSDDRRFALKTLTGPRYGRDDARLAHEAEVAAGTHHENLVSVVDIGFARAGFLYIVMELVEGGSLDRRRDRYGDKPWAMPILKQIARGLAALHENGVVHRDLKPANILLADGERVKIADFGIARRDEKTAADPLGDTLAARHLTETGALVGTPLYMAPELALGGAARPPSDVFSFGVLAYELLTGRYPFTAAPFASALAGHAPVPASASTFAMVDACLSADPNERPTAAELARALG